MVDIDTGFRMSREDVWSDPGVEGDGEFYVRHIDKKSACRTRQVRLATRET